MKHFMEENADHFCVGKIGKTVDRSRIGADNFRESFHYSAKVEDSFQQTLREKMYHFSVGDLVFLKIVSYEGSVEVW